MLFLALVRQVPALLGYQILEGHVELAGLDAQRSRPRDREMYLDSLEQAGDRPQLERGFSVSFHRGPDFL